MKRIIFFVSISLACPGFSSGREAKFSFDSPSIALEFPVASLFPVAKAELVWDKTDSNNRGDDITFKTALLGLLSGSRGPMPGQYPIPPANAKTVYLEKTFTTFDGLTLHGHLALPSRATGKIPVVILLVGSGSGNRYEDVPGEVTSTGQPDLLFRSIEESLIDIGVAVFMYDKRGVIPTSEMFTDESVTDDFQSATAKNLAADAISAYDMVSDLPEVDPAKVLVLGHSEGTILALKVAEARTSVQSLILLGLFTRGLDDILRFQQVTSNMRIMGLIDENGDEYLDEQEVGVFHKEAPNNIPDWSVMLKIMDATGDGKISRSEQQFYFEHAFQDFYKSITDDTIPWKSKMPRDWFRQYFAEGVFLQRFAAFCNKINVVHGEADMQTSFEDALALRAECRSAGHSLESFSSFPSLGHGFSPRIGLKGWKDTVGPIDQSVLYRITEVVQAAIK